MWTNEEGFASAAGEEATLVFDQLCPNLLSSVLIIGVPYDGQDQHAAPCVLFDEETIAPSDLLEVLPNANERHRQFREGGWSVVGAGMTSDEYLQLVAVREALCESIRGKVESKGQTAFCSLPVGINGYRVSVVLLFDRTLYQSFPSLRSPRQGRPFGVSLLESAKDEFLDGCQDALRRPDPGHNLNVLERDPEEVLRAAGKRFLDGPACSFPAKGRQYSFFRAFDELSSLFYEGREGKGSILLAYSQHPHVEMKVVLEPPAHVSDRRAFRKLVEVASAPGSHLVVSRFGDILGIGALAGTYDPKREDLFEVRLVRHHTWELAHDRMVLMQVEFGIPLLPKPKVDTGKLKDHLRRLFPNMQVKDRDQFVSLVSGAASSRHGTTVVIHEHAAEEAKRLKGECWLIRPTGVEDCATLKGLTSIDGALLFDPSCACHAIGVILDGETTGRGTPARGARYNSAVRYVRNAKAGVLVVIVSQDGIVNLIPDLRPQFPRKEIEAKIAELQSLDEDRCLDVKKLNPARGWFEDKRDYLTGAYCDQINSLWNSICARFPPPQPVDTTAGSKPVPSEEFCDRLLKKFRSRPLPFTPLEPSKGFDERDLLDG